MNELEIKTKVMVNNVIQRMVIESQVYFSPTLYTLLYNSSIIFLPFIVSVLMMTKTYGDKPLVFAFDGDGEQYMIGSEVIFPPSNSHPYFDQC